MGRATYAPTRRPNPHPHAPQCTDGRSTVVPTSYVPRIQYSCNPPQAPELLDTPTNKSTRSKHQKSHVNALALRGLYRSCDLCGPLQRCQCTSAQHSSVISATHIGAPRSVTHIYVPPPHPSRSRVPCEGLQYQLFSMESNQHGTPSFAVHSMLTHSAILNAPLTGTHWPTT